LSKQDHNDHEKRFDNKIKEMTINRDNEARIIEEKIDRLKEEKRRLVGSHDERISKEKLAQRDVLDKKKQVIRDEKIQRDHEVNLEKEKLTKLKNERKLYQNSMKQNIPLDSIVGTEAVKLPSTKSLNASSPRNI